MGCDKERNVVLKRKRWLELEKKKVDMDKQKAKIKWATEGDENSKLFHAAIKHREKKLVRGLIILDGWIEEPEKIKDHFFNLFQR